VKKIELGMTSVSQSRGHRADSRHRPDRVQTDWVLYGQAARAISTG